MTTASEVLVFSRGQLSPKDKERLTKAGIVAVEADSPHQVTRISMSPAVHLDAPSVTGDAIVTALLKGIAAQPAESTHGSITAAGRAAHAFVKELAIALAKGEAP